MFKVINQYNLFILEICLILVSVFSSKTSELPSQEADPVREAESCLIGGLILRVILALDSSD